MARLVLINGAPGTGKSTLAHLHAQRHPLTLALELDVLRSMLGGWLEQPTEAGLSARAMAIAAARVHLQTGHDVLIPQHVGRLEFIHELDRLAEQTGARFVEIMLITDVDDAVARFARRSAKSRGAAHLDAARLLAACGGEAELRAMHERLRDVLAVRAATITIAAVEGDIDGTYAQLAAAIDG